MPDLFTFGYAGSTPAAVKHYVDTTGALLVDIRFSPRSRDPRWQVQALVRLLGTANYIWVEELGNPNDKNGGPVTLFRPRVAAHILRPIIRERSLILLCACARVEFCHRRLAAAYLANVFGIPRVEHLPASPAHWTMRTSAQEATEVTL